METVVLILRSCLFGFCFCGFCCLVNRFLKLPLAFVPILVCCGLGCLLVLTGILNILGIVPLLFVLAGLYGLFYEIKKGGCFRWWQNPAVLFLVIGSIYCFVYLYGHYITANDDFNNWAIVPRVMLRYDRLPRFTDWVILFPSYPTGTAGFIYLVCTLLGSDSGGSLLFAQAFLLVCSILPLFALVRRHKVINHCAIVATALILLTLNGASPITTLYVDTLLGLVCLSGVVIGCHYRENMAKGWPLMLVIGSFLAVVKGSGIYFSVVLALQAVFAIWRQTDKRGRWRCVLMMLGVPLCLLLLWNRHADLVFEGGLMTRHSTSLRYMLNLFINKGWADSLLIVKRFFATLGDFATMRACLGTALVVLGLGALGRIRPSASPFRPRTLLVCSAAIYITYLIGLLGMYVFNLPEDTIESFTRYEHTILLVVVGLSAIYFIQWLNGLPEPFNSKGRLWLLAPAGLLIAFCLLAPPSVDTLIHYPVEDEAPVQELHTYMTDRDKEARYLVYIWDGHREQNYGHRMVHYTAYPSWSDIVSSDPDDAALLESWPEHYDYFIPFWTDETYEAYAAAHGIDPKVKLWSAEEFLAVQNTAK